MPTKDGFYGEYGGQFVPETLVPAIDQLERAFLASITDEAFLKENDYYLRKFAGRPTPLYHAANLSKKYGVEIWLKREDMLHTGAHKINNTIGQALLTRYMGKKRVIAETGAGQHGVATATVCALFGLECTVYMGVTDARRQQPNVRRMELLGAEVREVTEGQQTLKDAVNAAMQDWVTNVETTHYLIGSALGPHPFPEMVAQFQSVIGREAKEACQAEGFMPDSVVACIGGGSNAIGIFRGFLEDTDVQLIGVEAGGISDEPGKHARSIGIGTKGIFQGSASYVVQTPEGQIDHVHSVSAGLDYASVGPEHAYLNDIRRVSYEYLRDTDALNAFKEVSRMEGIIPALESSHAVGYVLKNADRFKGQKVIVNLSGRGDKDLAYVLAGGVK